MIAEDRCRQDGRDLPLSRAAPADDQRAGRAGLVIGPDLGCTPREQKFRDHGAGPGPGGVAAGWARDAAGARGAGCCGLCRCGPGAAGLPGAA